MHYPFRADCHCHSHFSDGALSVQDLILAAKAANLQGLAITDHDTIDAYETAIPLAREQDISLVSGIELSAQYQGASIHVLGYAFDLKHPAITALCKQQQQQRHDRNLAILDKLKKLRFEITLDELTAAFPFRSLGRPHIATLMVQKGYVSSIKNAFERYLGERKRCYVGGFDLSVEDAIRTIQMANGFAVLAHPYVIQPARIVTDVMSFPFDGIEVYYGTFHKGKEYFYLNEAKKRDWFITGGSDFHGPHKSYPKLGSSFTPHEVFEKFEKRFASHRISESI